MRGTTLLALCLATPLLAQSFDPSLLKGLRWRCIGPHRGGRTVAACGVPSKPGRFYMAANNGGVWRSEDYGHTWVPIFDDQPTGSIGSLAVAPSNPDILYVGSGEGLQRPDLSTGDGLYRSADGGKSWVHLGLRDGQQIPAILVDPKDPNRLFVAVLGHPYGPNEERGVYRSTDGGRTLQKVLGPDADTGAVALAFDPWNAQVVYASLWSARQAPWENGAFRGTGSGLFKSTDGSSTWKRIGQGLPGAAEGLSRIGFAVAPTRPQRVYAQVEAKKGAGTYRSDDAGETFTLVNAEGRVSGRGEDFAEIRVHPGNPDILFAANTSTYRSDDGGRTWTAIKGAPGGDDYHTIWIDPNRPEVMILGADQGATVTVNGGRTWSSWYNQPTAQFYHVITDDQFPYWVYGGQQESGSVGIRSRGDHGAISFRDWTPVGVEEYGYVAPDPRNPDLIYGGKASVFDRRTGQTRDISPDPLRLSGHRFLRTMPILFSPADPKTLFLAGEVVFKTTDGGAHWEEISKDLSRKEWAVPASVGVFKDQAKVTQRGVVYALAPSPKDVSRLWAGTDDGLIHLTVDGHTWFDVTPKGLAPWSKIAQLEASHFDEKACYAAVNTLRLDDLRPHVYRTRDNGKSWREITEGLPEGTIVNTIREDPAKKGLLFAGTEQAVFVSFDDGDHWQALRLNMPATSIRDLVVHGDDLVVGTHGRSFWILDDLTPLRELGPDLNPGSAHFFKPQVALRWRRNLNPDTPLPPEEPVGENPPEGAILDYWLPSSAKSLRLEILDGENKVIRRFDAMDPAKPVDPATLNVPAYWMRPPQLLQRTAGMHRVVWDLRLSEPAAFDREPPISALYMDTPMDPRGALVPPGAYKVRLTVDGKVQERPLTVRMDPRVKTPEAGLQRQFALAKWLAEAMDRTFAAAATAAPEKKGALTALNGRLAGLLGSVEQADAEPTPAQSRAAETLFKQMDPLLQR